MYDTDSDDGNWYRRVEYLLMIPWAVTVVLVWVFVSTLWTVVASVVGLLIIFIQFVLAGISREVDEEALEEFEEKERTDAAGRSG